MVKPPKYSELEVQNIMESSQALPEGIPESVYEHQLRDNSKLKWTINPFLARENRLNLILSADIVAKWRLLKRLNWVIALLIVVFSIWMNDPRILWGLLILASFTVSGMISIRTMVSIMVLIYASQYRLGYHSKLVMYFIIIIAVTYILSKMAFDFAGKKIIQLAFGDPNTFWKFYTNKFIFIDPKKVTSEFQKLKANYPELNT
jgi:hypothetical protein